MSKTKENGALKQLATKNFESATNKEEKNARENAERDKEWQDETCRATN